MLFFWIFYLSENPEKEISQVSSKTLCTTTVFFFTFIFIKNIYLASNQHIRMISEGSCDIEDWSNDAENSALHHRNEYNEILYLNILLFKYFTVLLYMKENLTLTIILNASVHIVKFTVFLRTFDYF